MKIGDRIAWRYKNDKCYNDSFIKEINGGMIRIADSRFGEGIWYKIQEIEIEVLEGR